LYYYKAKKKNRQKALKARFRSFYFADIAQVFDTDMHAFVDKERKLKYKYIFSPKKWSIYMYAALMAFLNYFMALTVALYKRRAVYFKVIREF